MTIIRHDLLLQQRSRRPNFRAEIELYPYATELYEELNDIEIIGRIKNIPQLGIIKVKKRLRKTRYDYMMLQLYLHQLIKKNLQGQLQLTYNNPVKACEFSEEFKYSNKDKMPTLGDILQLLTIVYNIGHFYNTFTASRAVIIMASQNDTFRNMIYDGSNDCRYQEAASKILDNQNYQIIHLINSLLVLKKCDQTKPAVVLATEVLYAYINKNTHKEESKLNYIFSIFRSVRTVSYMAYDLEIANIPLTIDLCNEGAMILLLKELLSEYNNTLPTQNLVESISKLLDDTVYNENSNAICYYRISRRIATLLRLDSDFTSKNFYDEFFIPKDSVFNKPYLRKRDYIEENILKLTFQSKYRDISRRLLSDLEKINNLRVGYYDRHFGEQTILISIKKKCEKPKKTIAAFRALKCTLSALKKNKDLDASNIMYLLGAKFFLFYLFDENPVVIKPTIDKKKCVLCTRGKKRRVKEVNFLLENSIGNEDENHEAQFMINYLNKDEINDTSICIPSSILVYKKDFVGRKLCEFDGLVIHPMRKKEQIIFLEAKNTANRPGYSKKCLKEKLDKFSFCNSNPDIQNIAHDAIFKYSVGE